MSVRNEASTAGYQFVIAAPWLPIADAPPRWSSSAGSAARTLRSVAAERDGAWVGCTTAEAPNVSPLDRVWVHPVEVEPEDAEGYLSHCNRTLTPLYQDGGQLPRFEKGWRDSFRNVNRQVAATAASIAAPGATVWVQGHHLQLAPAYLRRHRPDVRIGFYLHSAFPPAERFRQLPMRDQVIDSLMSADLIGFPDQRSAARFAEVAAFGRDDTQRHADGRRVRVGVFPPAIDATTIAKLAIRSDVIATTGRMRANLGHPSLVLLSVGTPDDTAGTAARLQAYAELIASGRLDPAQTVLIHVASCGDSVDDCGREELDRQVARINGDHATIGHPVVQYLHRELDLTDLVALYRTADVMLATPLRHGPSLAAHEYVATRTENTGTVILSEFAATDALADATIVNPYDSDALAHAILAVEPHCREASDAMRRMRHRLHHYDTETWAEDYLAALDSAATDDPTVLRGAR